MGSFLRSFLSDVLAALVTMGLAAVVAFLAWLQDIPWYQLALGVIFAFAGSLFLINQFRNWWPTRRMLDDRWLSDAIALWLLGSKFTVEKITTENTKFHFKVGDRFGRAFSIMKKNENPNDLSFSFRLSVEDKDIPFVDRLDTNIASDLIENMQIEMARFGVLHSGMQLPIREMYIESFIPIDFQLGRFKIVQHSLMMIRAHALLSVHILRAIRLAGGSPPKPDSDKEDNQKL